MRVSFFKFVGSVVLYLSNLRDRYVLTSARRSGWTSQHFPNPQINPQACGFNSSAFVCDPDGVLMQQDESTVKDLSDLVIATHTNSTKLCRQSNPDLALRGYSISIAVVERLSGTRRMNIRARRFHLWQFLRNLRVRRWPFARCTNSVIIGVSRNDESVVILFPFSKNAGTRSTQTSSNRLCSKKLLNKHIDLIEEKLYVEVLVKIVSDLKLLAKDRSICIDEKNPITDFLDWLAFPITAGVLIGILLILGVYRCIYLRRKRQRSERRSGDYVCDGTMDKVVNFTNEIEDSTQQRNELEISLKGGADEFVDEKQKSYGTYL